VFTVTIIFLFYYDVKVRNVHDTKKCGDKKKSREKIVNPGLLALKKNMVSENLNQKLYVL